MGSEDVRGLKTLKYDWVDDHDGARSRHIIWLNQVTGLPARAATYEIDVTGRERPSAIYDSIQINCAAPAAMFSFETPEGYRLEENEGQPASFSVGSGTAGNDRSAQRHAFVIDRLAILVCWHHGVEGTDMTDPEEDPATPQAALFYSSGSGVGESSRRECELHQLRTQVENGQLWRWSLAVPLDRRPVNPDVSFQLAFKFPSGSRASYGSYPLKLDDERLKNAISRMQELGMPVGKIQPEMTLLRLRWLAARYLTRDADNVLPSEVKKSEKD